ncbi:hypothetical protein [Adlercreutzia sp. ZJ473]|uniref:hypothetical protein n=1 Tax=Adlercreutzia sp. ZJ473 TaxID=2722822 RepID=UPI001552B0C2|nr:hypothetical protein [Adlercreutzia sp. ZJ473]
MHEREFEHRYHQLQKSITASDDLKSATRMLMREAAASPAPDASAHASEGAREKQPAPRRMKRAGLAVAACVIALLLAFGTLPAVLSGNSPAEPQFAVKAYADALDEVIEPNDAGLVVFPYDTKIGFQDTSAEGTEEGTYTGALFTVEGESITRVQATLSEGELYRYSFDRFTLGDEPEKARELLSWKPTKRGTGTYYADYDYVISAAVDDDLSHADPDKQMQARLIKRLGPTVDLAVSDSEPLYLGLWLDEASAGAGGMFDVSALEGATLTVTAQFDDGTFQTQTIDLHVGWFACERAAFDEGSAADLVPVGEPLDEAVLSEGADACRTLYGITSGIANTPHPYPLDTANEHAGAPVDALPLESVLSYRGTLEPADYTAGDGQVRAAGEHVDIALAESLSGAGEAQPLEVGLISAETLSTLPASYDLRASTQVAGMGGDLDYFNVCRRVTHGFTVGEDGSLSEEFSYVVVRLDVTNASGEATSIVAQDLGAPCALGPQGVTFSSCGLFAASGWEGCEGDNTWQTIPLPAHETRSLELVYIVDDKLFEAGELALSCPAGGLEQDLAQVQFLKMR